MRLPASGNTPPTPSIRGRQRTRKGGAPGAAAAAALTAAVLSSRQNPANSAPPARGCGRAPHGGTAREERPHRNVSRVGEGRQWGHPPAPSPHPAPPLRSPLLPFSPRPRSPVCERQVPASCAPQAPQHRVQRRRLRPARPLVTRERSADEVPSGLQPALLLGRSRETRLQRCAAGRPRSPPWVTHRRAGFRHDSTRLGLAARLTALPWQCGAGNAQDLPGAPPSLEPAGLRPLPSVRPIAAAGASPPGPAAGDAEGRPLSLGLRKLRGRPG